MTLSAFAAAVLGAAVENPADTVKKSGFDGFDGQALAYYERNYGPSEEYFSTLTSIWVHAGKVNAQWHIRRFEFRAGLGGVVWSPQYRGYDSFSNRIARFWPYLPELNMRLRFGPPGSPEGVQGGLFILETNPDAALFGNYLARYGPYSDGEERQVFLFDSLGASDPMVRGIRFAQGTPGSALRTDVLVLNGIDDLSFLGFLSGTVRPGVEWGLGFEWYRAISLSSHRDWDWRSSGYVRTDTGYIPLDWARQDTAPPPEKDINHYHRDAGMLSARVSVDFGQLTGGDGRGWRDAALFSEVALLGWANQPIIYEDRMRRLAWTVGARLPAFGWLEVFTVQWEWRPTAYHPSDRAVAAGWVGQVLKPGNSISPWSAGLLVSKNLGRWFALQGRVLSEPETPRYYSGMVSTAYLERDPPSRQVRMQFRTLYRLP